MRQCFVFSQKKTGVKSRFNALQEMLSQEIPLKSDPSFNPFTRFKHATGDPSSATVSNLRISSLNKADVRRRVLNDDALAAGRRFTESDDTFLMVAFEGMVTKTLVKPVEDT